MNIYLKWKSKDTFEISHISIFNLELSQKENDFAKAKLTIDVLAPLPPIGTEGILQKEDESVLLKGRLVATSTHVDAHFAEIELIAVPFDFQEEQTRIQKKERIHPYWNPLWVKPEKHNDFQDIQSVRTASLYGDRQTGKLSWSDWFRGRQILPLDQAFFQDSLSIKMLAPPFKACTVKVTAHWIQSESGVVNLSSSIRRAFPHFKMSTYTQQSILTKWPQAGQHIGKSGFWILKSELKPIRPSGGLYKQFSPSLSLQEKGQPSKTHRLIRHWFKPTLWVGWSYQQKRTETLSLTLFHDDWQTSPTTEEHKVLEFTLQNINPDPKTYTWKPEAYYREGSKIIYKNRIYRCHTSHTSGLIFEEDQTFWNFKKIFYTPLGNPARSSFFLTDCGYRAAEHAMERAKVELAKRARCLEVSFEGPWEALESVTTDTSISLSDPRLPGGKITGKVVEWILTAKGETGERWGKVTLLSPMGQKEPESTDGIATPSYALDDYCEESYQIHNDLKCQTPSGLTYFRYDDQIPQNDFKEGSFLRGIELINGPLEQEDKMRGQTGITPAQLEKVLAQNPTRLRLFFKDLRTKERLEHLISVKMAAPWSPPKPQ